MRLVVILGHKRGEYFRLPRVRRDAAGALRVVALYARAHEALLSDEFRAEIDAPVPLEALDFESCRGVIAREAAAADAGAAVLVCADEELLFLAARLRESLGIPGIRPGQLIPYKSKRLMKQLLGLRGVRAPRFLDLDARHCRGNLDGYFEHLSRLLGTPFIVKPIDGGASENTSKVSTPADLAAWMSACAEAAGESTAEEFIEGEMFCCDGLLQGGRPVIHEAWRYLAPCLNFMSGQGIGGIPLRREDPLRALLLAFNERALAALECPDGAFHDEFIVRADGEIVFIEAAARPPGNLNPLILEKNFGVNPYEALLRQELGLPQPSPSAGEPTYAYALLPVRPGTVRALRPPPISSLSELTWVVKVGDVVARGPRSISEGIAAKVVLHNRRYERLESDLKALRDHEPY